MSSRWVKAPAVLIGWRIEKQNRPPFRRTRAHFENSFVEPVEIHEDHGGDGEVSGVVRERQSAEIADRHVDPLGMVVGGLGESSGELDADDAVATGDQLAGHSSLSRSRRRGSAFPR